MFYYNDFSHYEAENILHKTSTPAHSGPELMPDTIHADRLAREVVLDKISLLATERPTWTTVSSSERTFKMIY